MAILNTIPEKFDGPSAWVGADLQTRQGEWLYTLSADDISEIEHAARHYLSFGRDVGEITAQDFPLPQFSDHLNKMSEKQLQEQYIKYLQQRLLKMDSKVCTCGGTK